VRPLAFVLLVAACGGGTTEDVPDSGAAIGQDLSRDIESTALEIDLAAKTGVARIVIASATEVAPMSFEIGDLAIDAVTGAGPLRFEDTGDRLDVEVPAGTTELTIRYAFLEHTRFDGWLEEDLTFTWPIFCGNLFPCHSDPADGTTFTLSLTNVPDGVTAVYPASIDEQAPSYMLAWAIGDYTYAALGTTDSGTTVGVYHLGRGPLAMVGTAHLVEAFGWLETTVGGYRFGDTVASVEAHWGAGAYGGMEHHPLWHIAEAALGDEETHVHEAAHGWFGDGVRIGCWESFTLSEGTVSYLAAKALSAVGGPDLWPSYETRLADLAGAAHPIAWPEGCNTVDVLRDLYTDVPYMKGAFFLRAVEGKVGETELLATLRAFHDRYAGASATVEDLLEAIQMDTGFDATTCALAWLRSSTIPSTRVCD
jgi:aminopeptidase N